jgi:hypothetical protein
VFGSTLNGSRVFTSRKRVDPQTRFASPSLGYVAPLSDTPSTSKTVFVKPVVLEPPHIAEDKGKDKVNDDVPGTQQLPSIRRPPICHHCGLSGHVRPQCSLLKAQKAKAKKEVPRQAHHGIRPEA